MRVSRAVSISLLAISLTACGHVRAGQSSTTSKAESAPKAKTKLEAFQAKTGAVIISGFSTIGSVPGSYGGRVSVETREFTDAADGTKEYGIAINVSKGGELEEKSTSYVDYDEIDSLLKGITYISKIDGSVTKLDDFQADYRTKGDLKISTFSDHKGKVMAAVQSGIIGQASAYFPLSGLDQFRTLIDQAKAKLDSIK